MHTNEPEPERTVNVNVGQIERWISGVAGASLLAGALVRRSFLLGIVGSALLSRGLTGHSALYARLGFNTARPPSEPARERDQVDEASWESFPASDPPAYSDTGVGGPH